MPGVGLIVVTVMKCVPAVAKLLSGIVVFNIPVPTYVVVSWLPSIFTFELGLNWEPYTVRAMGFPPVTEAGSI